MKNRKIVLNSEPNNYSQQAIEIWISNGYDYKTIDNLLDIDKGRVEVLIVRLAKYVDDKFLNVYPNLKCVISATTGLDHINIDYLNSRNIKLYSLREHSDFLKTIPSTAEHTWALIMSLVRKIPQANEHVKEGGWDRDFFRGIQLKGKKIGILGLGRIGRKVAEYANAFEMEVIYYDPRVIDPQFKSVDSIEKLLSESDIATIHIHLSQETQKIINWALLEKVKPGMLLINTSRGYLLDELSIIKALENGLLGGIAVDVLVGENDSLVNNPILIAQRSGLNVIVTPHIGGATFDAMWACELYLVYYFLRTNLKI